MKALKKTLQRGDTIVEVMIAMAVLGLVLASAFAISNRSYATGINAQERNEALKVAESQVELLRIASTLTDESIIDADPSRLFCIEPSGTKLERIEFASGAVVEDQGELDETQYPTIGAIDGDCNFGTSDRYYVSIQQSADIDDETNQPTGGQIFSVRVYWESIFGGFSNVVNHEYRTYNFEGTFSLIPPVISCQDDGATNIGDPLPCEYPCEDEDANNIGDAADCTFDPASINIVVRKIPPAAGNNTPSCTSSATQNRGGTTVRLNGIDRSTNSASTASYTNLITNTDYDVSATSAPPGHQLCPPTTVTVATGGPGSSETSTDFKIRPLCYIQQTGTTAGYWTRGQRRAELDNWYTTNNGSWPTWSTYIVAGHYATPGTFWYQYSGSVSGTAAYYYLYQANWVSGSPIYTRSCPS